MNNKELISELARRLGKTQSEVTQDMESVTAVFKEQLADGKTIHINGFGSFEVKKKAERISIHPVTKKRVLIPPKLSLAFKPSSVLKEKFNKLQKP